MRFEVPQFIEIEDKIFGPFTWRQFIYLVGGVGLAGVLFLTTNIFIFLIIGLPIGGLALLLAFYQINNRPFSVFLESMAQFFSRTKLYLWRKGGTGVYEKKEGRDSESPIASLKETNTMRSLNTLSRQLELKAIQKEST